jgi:hypothetical protein
MNIKDIENLSVPELLKLVKKDNITLPSKVRFMSKEQIADAIIKYINTSKSGEV